jgi:hypothetical protein
MNDIIRELEIGRKGHWGIVEPLYVKSRWQVFRAKLESLKETAILELDCATRFVSVESVAQVRDELEAEVSRSGRKRFCCLLAKFHELPADLQRGVLSMSRGIREASTEVAFQTVAFGSWNRYRLWDSWKREPNLSPCPDQNKIRSLESLDLADLKEMLLDEAWISRARPEIADIAVESFAEFTGGDLFFVGEVLDSLRMSGLILSDVHQVLEDVAHSDTVFSELARRMSRLSPDAQCLLRSVLESHELVVNARNPDLEDLRLGGFVSLERLGDIVSTRVLSPVLEVALRVGGQRISDALEGIYPGTDLAKPSKAINKQAYGIVLEIETLLRNWIVTALSKVTGSDWRADIAGVKVPGCDAEAIAEEIRILGDNLFAALHPELDLAALNEREKPVDVPKDDSNPKTKVKKPMVGVVESAEEWRSRWERHPAVRLSESPLPSFMTTGSLMNIYMAKGSAEAIIKATFGSREDAKVFFTRFNTIRSAVAHNQSLAFSAIEELVGLKKELCIRLSNHKA